jgi:hypothetical protein
MESFIDKVAPIISSEKPSSGLAFLYYLGRHASKPVVSGENVG